MWRVALMYLATPVRSANSETWALQARMFMREFEPTRAKGLTVYILCTLRSLDGDPEIHAQGMRALAASNWARQDLSVRVPVQALA